MGSSVATKRFFFLHHEDLYASQLTMDRWIRSFLGDGFDPTLGATSQSQVNTFYASKDPSQNSLLFEQVSMPLMGAGVSVVVVRDYAQLKGRDAVQHLIQHAFPNCYLVFVRSGVDFPSKSLQQFAESRADIEVVQHRKPKRSQLQKRIRDLLESHSLNLSAAALELLVESHAEFPDNLPQEVEKVALYFADQHRKEAEAIEASEVAPLIYEDKSAHIFDFADKFLSESPVEVLRAFLDFLNSSGDLVALQAVLSNGVAKAIDYLELRQQNVPEPKIFSELNVYYSSGMQRLRRHARRRSLADYYLLFEAVLDLERVLKTESLMGVSVDRGRLNHQAKHVVEKIILNHL